jgi:hypothetical protein
MDILKMISELRAERENIEQAIIALERVARSGGKRRGRPPKWMTDGVPTATKAEEKRKRVFSAKTKRKMALAQKRRWAAARKARARS